jgi:uncharacterized membrane protein YhaH (DUF805 family)
MFDGMNSWPEFLDPNGRSGRVLFLFAASGLAALEVAEHLAPWPAAEQAFATAGVIYLFWFIFIALPRRAHDVGHSAVAFWLLYLLLSLPFLVIYVFTGSGAVPAWMNGAVIWALITLALVVWPGSSEPNRWGPARDTGTQLSQRT